MIIFTSLLFIRGTNQCSFENCRDFAKKVVLRNGMNRPGRNFKRVAFRGGVFKRSAVSRYPLSLIRIPTPPKDPKISWKKRTTLEDPKKIPKISVLFS